MNKPKEFENDLGEYGPMIFDSYCGEPIMWGFKILNHLGEQKFKELGQHGSLECCYPSWFLIIKSLSREEAIKKYGKVTAETFGPRGGWKSTTFGKTMFISRVIKPK